MRVILPTNQLSGLAGAVQFALSPLLGGCSDAGTALGPGSAAAGVTKYPTSHPRIGMVWDLSFPFLANHSAHSVTVTGFSIAHVPRGIKVLRYRVLNVHQTHGLLDVATPGDSDPRFNVRRFRNYIGRPITVAPGKVSPFYAMVEIKLSGRTHQDLRGCVVHYKTDGKTYAQTLGCDYSFHNGPKM